MEDTFTIKNLTRCLGAHHGFPRVAECYGLVTAYKTDKKEEELYHMRLDGTFVTLWEPRHPQEAMEDAPPWVPRPAKMWNLKKRERCEGKLSAVVAAMLEKNI